jgi:hypothetical protein
MYKCYYDRRYVGVPGQVLIVLVLGLLLLSAAALVPLLFGAVHLPVICSVSDVVASQVGL